MYSQEKHIKQVQPNLHNAKSEHQNRRLASNLSGYIWRCMKEFKVYESVWKSVVWIL